MDTPLYRAPAVARAARPLQVGSGRVEARRSRRDGGGGRGAGREACRAGRCPALALVTACRGLIGARWGVPGRRCRARGRAPREAERTRGASAETPPGRLPGRALGRRVTLPPGRARSISHRAAPALRLPPDRTRGASGASAPALSLSPARGRLGGHYEKASELEGAETLGETRIASPGLRI